MTNRVRALIAGAAAPVVLVIGLLFPALARASIIGDATIQGVGTNQCVSSNGQITDGAPVVGQTCDSTNINEDANFVYVTTVTSSAPFSNTSCPGCNNALLGDEVVNIEIGPGSAPLPPATIATDASVTPPSAVIASPVDHPQDLVLVPAGSGNYYIASVKAANHTGTIEFLGDLGTSGTALHWDSQPTYTVHINQ